MSVCDEGWETRNGFCPAIQKVRGFRVHCGMGIFYEEQPLGGLIYPDTCPYAPILKLLAEAKEVGPINVKHDKDRGDIRYLNFWVRR